MKEKKQIIEDKSSQKEEDIDYFPTAESLEEIKKYFNKKNIKKEKNNAK